MYGISLVAVTTKKRGTYSVVAVPTASSLAFIDSAHPHYKMVIKEVCRAAKVGKQWLATTGQLLTAPCDLVTVISGDRVHHVTLGRTPLTGTKLEDHIPYHE